MLINDLYEQAGVSFIVTSDVHVAPASSIDICCIGQVCLRDVESRRRSFAG